MSQKHTDRNTNPDIVVLGAGLAGLGAGLMDPRVTIYEANAHSGGHAYSRKLGDFHFDEGAHIIHSRKDWYLDLLERSCPNPHVMEGSSVRSYWHGTWLGYPVQNHLSDLPIHMTIEALSSLVTNNLRSQGTEPSDYEAWVRASYGDILAEKFYEVFTRKYWRREMKALATDWLRGRLIPADLENIIRGAFGIPTQRQDVFRTFRYPRSGGFFAFFEPLYESLNVHHGYPAQELNTKARKVHFKNGEERHYDFLVPTIPLPELVTMTADAPAAIRSAAKTLNHTQLLCVNIVVDRPDVLELDWFYVYDEEIDASRVSAPSRLSGSQSNQTALQAEIFRDHREPLNPHALADKALKDLGLILKFAPNDVAHYNWHRVPYAYVVSDLDRPSAVSQILRWYESRQVIPAGLYGRWSYLWSDQSLESGMKAIEHIYKSVNNE